MADLELRPFCEADFATLAGWFDSAFDVLRWGGQGLAYPLAERHLAQMLAETRSVPPARAAWTACSSGIRVGHAQLAFADDPCSGRLCRVAIAPEWRGRGLGEKLVRTVLELAFGALALDEVQLRVMLGNAPARHLYEKLGFEPVDPRRASNLPPDKFILMALRRR